MFGRRFAPTSAEAGIVKASLYVDVVPLETVVLDDVDVLVRPSTACPKAKIPPSFEKGAIALQAKSGVEGMNAQDEFMARLFVLRWL